MLAASYHTTFQHLQQVKCRNAKRELKPCSGCRAGHRWRRQAHGGGGSQEVFSKHWPSTQQPNSAGHRRPSRHNKHIYPQERCWARNEHPVALLLAKPDHFVPCKHPYLEQVLCTLSLSPCPLPFHSHQCAGKNAQAILTTKMK